MRLDQLIQRLKGVKTDSNGYVAPLSCPRRYHPSLSISTGDDGRILLKCHAGCSIEAVLASVAGDEGSLLSDAPVHTSPVNLKPAVHPIGAEFYQSANDALLTDSDQFDNLLNKRGISEETIHRFMIGLQHEHGKHESRYPCSMKTARLPRYTSLAVTRSTK